MPLQISATPRAGARRNEASSSGEWRDVADSSNDTGGELLPGKDGGLAWVCLSFVHLASKNLGRFPLFFNCELGWSLTIQAAVLQQEFVSMSPDLLPPPSSSSSLPPKGSMLQNGEWKDNILPAFSPLQTLKL